MFRHPAARPARAVRAPAGLGHVKLQRPQGQGAGGRVGAEADRVVLAGRKGAVLAVEVEGGDGAGRVAEVLHAAVGGFEVLHGAEAGVAVDLGDADVEGSGVHALGRLLNRESNLLYK